MEKSKNNIEIYQSNFNHILHFIFWINKGVLPANKIVMKYSISNINYINLKI